MTTLLVVLTLVLAVAAAVRSTWSPCGRSMLSTITPLGERGRRGRYRSTASFFFVGALLGGALLGALSVLLALGFSLLRLPAPIAALVAAALSLLVAASDTRLAGFELPIHRRQVNERWLDTFRPWFYGLGFGAQIGSGLATYITTAALYLLVALAALTATPAAALAAGLLFGAVRGASVLLVRHITSPAALRALHRRLELFDSTAARLTVLVEISVAAALLTAVWWPALVLLAAAAVGTGLVRTVIGRAPAAPAN